MPVNTGRELRRDADELPVAVQFLSRVYFLQLLHYLVVLDHGFGCFSKDNGSFLGGSVLKNPPANAGDAGSILGLERSPGEGNGNPVQYACLGNPTDRGTCWAIVQGVAKQSDTNEQLNNSKWLYDK